MSTPHLVDLIDGWQLSWAPPRLGANEPIAGVLSAQHGAVGFDDAMLGRHVLFLGGIGTGKTVGMTALVRSLRSAVDPDDVFVIFDTKGDYLEEFYSPGDAVLSLDGRHLASVTWNLFRDLGDPNDPQFTDTVTEVAATLFADTAQSAGDNNAVWPLMARDLFAALVIAQARTHGSAALTNADIRRMVDSMTLHEIHELLSPHEDLRGVLQYVAKEGSNTTISVMIFLQQAVRSAFIGSFREPGSFSVKNFLRAKGSKTMFCEWDVASGEAIAPIFRTIIDIALKESLGRERAKGRVWVVLDEFALLPKLTHLEAGLNFGRSLGMRFVVGTQNVGQVRAAYGEAGGDSVLSAFGTVFSFRLYDKPSRDFVRDRYGMNRKLVRYESALKTRGVIEERVDGSVIEDWDITGLQVGQCIVALPDGPPHLFQFAAPEVV